MKYFISYFYVNKWNNSFGFGNTEIDREPPIINIDEIKSIKQTLEHDNPNLEYTLINWRKFEPYE